MAGVNEQGELRRIYPVPFIPHVYGGGIPFHKKEWIEAELRMPDNKREKRSESREINMSSVKVLRKVDDDEVRRVVRSNLSVNIGELKTSGASLGFIKPRVVDYECDIISTKTEDEQLQITEEGVGTQSMIKLKQESVYHFDCQKRENCTCANQPHRMIIQDWEANELYRNVISRDKDPAVIKAKMRQRWFDSMLKRDIYFMLGTHFLHKTWMIVSVLYLKPH